MFSRLKKKASLRAQSFKSSKGSYSFSDGIDEGGLSVIPPSKKRSSLSAIIATNEDSGEDNSPRSSTLPSQKSSNFVTDGTLSNEHLNDQKNGRFSTFFENTPVTSTNNLAEKRNSSSSSNISTDTLTESKSPPTVKKRKAPPPPPHRQSSLQSIPLVVENESFNDVRLEYQPYRPAGNNPNNVTIVKVNHDFQENYTNGQTDVNAIEIDEVPHRTIHHTFSAPTKLEAPYENETRPPRPEAVPPIDLSFIQQQPESIDTVRSTSSINDTPRSNPQEPDIAVNHTNHHPDLIHHTPSNTGQDTINNTPRSPGSDTSAQSIIVHGVDFGPLAAESSTDFLEVTDNHEQFPSKDEIPSPPEEFTPSRFDSPEPQTMSLRAAMQKRQKVTPKVYDFSSITPASSRSGNDSSRSNSTSKSNTSRTGSANSTPRDANGDPIAPPRSRSRSRNNSPRINLLGVVSDSSDTDALQTMSSPPTSPRSPVTRPTVRPPDPPTLTHTQIGDIEETSFGVNDDHVKYQNNRAVAGTEVDFDSVYSSDYDSQLAPSITSDIQHANNHGINNISSMNNQKQPQGSKEPSPRSAVEISSVPVINNDHNPHNNNNQSNTVYSNDINSNAIHYGDQLQTNNAYYPGHNADLGDTEVIIEDDYDHGFDGVLPIPHIPLDLADLTLESPSEDDCSIFNGVRMTDNEDLLNQKSLEDWNCTDITLWCRRKNMNSFAEIFEDSVMNGNILMQIEEQDLVDLEIMEPHLRNQFMQELSALKASHEKINRQRHAADTELESDVDEVMGSTSGSHPNLAHNVYLSGENLSQNPDIPLMAWNNRDVLSWLQTTGLQKFVTTFQEYNITGSDLAEISMQLLDDIQIRTTEDRELILSKLYELQNPSCPPLDHILHEPPFVTSPPVSGRSDESGKSSGRNKGLKKRESFQKVKGLVPQKLFGTQEKDVMDITVWHDLLADESQSTDVKVDSSMSSYDVIKQVLERYDVIADSRLYYLVQIHVTDSGKDRVYQHNDCPLEVVRLWEDSASSYKIVLQCERGTQIDIMCRLPVATDPNKTLSVAASSTCEDVINLCVEIYGLANDTTNVALFSQDQHSNRLTTVPRDTVISKYHSTSFVLSQIQSTLKDYHSDYKSMENISKGTHDDTLPQNPSSSEILQSLDEQMANIEASLKKKTNHLEKATHTPTNKEQEIIKSEISHGVHTIPPKPKIAKKPYITSMDQDEHLELLKEVELMKDSIYERDIIIQEYKSYNSALKEKANELSKRHESMNKSLSQQKQKESNFHLTYLDMKNKLKQQQLQLAIIQGDLDASVALEDTQTRLMDIHDKLQKQQHMVEELNRQPGNVDKSFLHKSESLLNDLRKEETLLYNEQHAVDEARKIRARNNMAQSLSLSRLISVEQSEEMIHLKIPKVQNGWGFLIGRDHRNLPMIGQHEASCLARKGDILLEINGKNVLSTSDQDVSKLLKDHNQSHLSILILRSKKHSRSHVTEEDMKKLKEELSLTLQELHTTERENQELRSLIERSQNQLTESNAQKQEMANTIEQLKQQATTSHTQWKELRGALKELRATDRDMRHNNIDPEILRLAGIEVSPRDEQNVNYGRRLDNNIINGHSLTSIQNGHIEYEHNKA